MHIFFGGGTAMVYASGAKQERMDVTWSGKKEETPGLKTFFFDEAVLVL